jgi:hypothetical protein
VKAAAVGTSRAIERAHAAEQARKRSQEQAAAAERTIRAMEQKTEETEQRIREAGLLMDAGINALHGDIIRAEREQNARLAKQAGDYTALLEQQAQASEAMQVQLAEQVRKEREALDQQALVSAEQIKEMRTGLRREMAVQREALEKEITRQRAVIESGIQKTREMITGAAGRIEAIEQASETHQKLARYWIEQTNGILLSMDAFRREESAQRSLDKIRGELERVKQDMEARAYESAIATGRRAFETAFELKERIAESENEWNQMYTLWQQQLAKVSEDFKDDEELMYEMETSEGIEKVPGNLNYWTNGKLQKAKDSFDALQSRMADAGKLPVEALREGIQELETLGAELAVIRQTGKANFVLSHNRYVQGCHFSDVLGENFAMTDCEGDYEGEEQRDSYVGIYKNPATKDTIVVKIQPMADESGIMNQNHLEVHYFNESNNEEQRRQWRQRINEELGGNKLCCKSRENLPSDQMQLANIEWVRRQKQQQAHG